MGLFSRPKKAANTPYQKSYATTELMPRVGWSPKWQEYSNYKAIREGYKRSTWVYACVRLRAANISSVPWVAKQGDEIDEGGELARLLAKPNPAFDLSDMLRRAVFMLDLTGDAYFTKVRNGAGRVVEVWPLIPDEMTVIPGIDSMVRAYKYRKGSITREVPADDIIHLMYSNPADLYYGLAPLQACARAVDIDEESEKWQKVSLQNMAVPPGVLNLHQDGGQAEYEQAKRWMAEQEGAANARKPLVLAGMTWQNIGQNPVDMDYVNGRRFTREEICSAFSVPPPLVGIYDNATLANIETARQILWREGLIPALCEIRGQLNLQLAAEFGQAIDYDLSTVAAIAEDYTEKLDNAQKMWALGIPLAIINKRLELGLDTDQIHGADIGYLPSGLLPSDFELSEPEPGGREMAKEVYGEDT
jgi:HK97 family phage portal protein